MNRSLIAASILSANFAVLGEDVSRVISAGADLIHFDVMDNHYVPNLSIGPMVLKSLRQYGISVPVDVHLMVTPVDNLILEFIRAGADFISFHLEASDHVDRSLQLIKDNGCKAGLVFNPSTPCIYLEYVIEKLDMIVLMSVNPGFGGQSFLPIVLNKIKQVRRLISQSECDILLSVDGGIKLGNISCVSNAGADVFVIGSEIFHQLDYRSMIDSLRIALL
ncbi:ribulose-phosphate 3-epimerase [Blochmannia endosymbiont of Polyrhachis (Hedomyrma) turneri]|uniref:ribulose-phosphate 3-epimerase n=1 Tax=Blochmannia endosymbiont of Polyrhachis (Hedomyrma) turneri TaxID=1505596 RepID=UPI00061A7C93|nr:ribulose-phosphate 3-epimerase [Blochmannia endosymbiont of Polyrhachis (Hedomyrma) turneri]AKC60128.1 ribulose-phosphate 3-epimerase [Blochmannia endosymbiont of Polyrhachis (Hedomyrma) turneri]